MARSGRRNASKALLWFVVVMAFIGYVFWALKEEEPFRIAHARLERSDQGISLVGEVSNRAAAVPLVNVEVTFYDRQGREVGKEIIALDDVAARATVAFRTPPRRLTDVQHYTIHVNTGRNPYGN